MKPTPAVLATLTEQERALFSDIKGVGDTVEEVKTILQKACDRSWKDETLYQTANIVSNAIYWRNREIENLKARVAALEGTLERITKVPTKYLRSNQMQSAIHGIKEQARAALSHQKTP